MKNRNCTCDLDTFFIEPPKGKAKAVKCKSCGKTIGWELSTIEREICPWLAQKEG